MPGFSDDLEATKAKLAKDAVNARWGVWMAPIMKIEIDPATQFPYLLPKQFFMP
jgi:L-rhamnose mutarotase